MLIIRNIITPQNHKIANLLHDSFAERLRDGMNFSCATYLEDDVQRVFSKATAIIGAYEEDELVGVVMLNCVNTKVGFRYASHENLAVATKAKGKGVAGRMLKKLRMVAVENKLDFVLSDTAEGAKSSIRYHLKNGFLIYGKRHYPGRNYNSVTFILPITWKGRLLSSWMGRQILRLFFCQ